MSSTLPTRSASRPASKPRADANATGRQAVPLPSRLDIHVLAEMQHLCQKNIGADLVLDASAVCFIDTAALKFLENLDTVRRTAGASVRYLKPSPAVVATFDLHGSKLASAELVLGRHDFS